MDTEKENTNKVFLMETRRIEQILRPVTPDIKDDSCVSLSRISNTHESKISDIKSLGTRITYSQMHMGQNLYEALHQNDIDFYNLLQVNDSVPQLPLEWFDDFNIEELLPHTWEKIRKTSALAFLPSVRDVDGQTSIISTSFHKFPLSSTSLKEKIGSRTKNNFNFWVDVQIIDYDKQRQKFKVIDSINFEEHYVSSIKINFGKEDSGKFVDRVNRAIRYSQLCQERIKYQLLLDCVPVNDIPSFSETIVNRIKVQMRDSNDKEFQNLIQEFNLHFKRVQAEVQMIHNRKESEESAVISEITEDSFQTCQKSQAKIHLNYDFSQVRHFFGWNSIFCQPEVFNVVQYISKSCTEVSHLCLFHVEQGPEIKIEFFDEQQKIKIDTITEFLQQEWPETLAKHILNKFKHITIGWFDTCINNWEIYQISKMSRFMMLMRHKMQEAIQALIVSSIEQYCDWLCLPCVSTLDVDDGYEWGDDVIFSPFSSEFPIFHLVLHMNEKIGAYYSSKIESFEEILLRNFDTAVLNTHFIKIIDPLVMKHLSYEPKLYLSSIGLMDERITIPRKYLQKCYQKAIIPLNAYAARFNEHLGFFAIDNTAYVQTFKEANKTMLEIKEEILLNIRMRQQLEEKLPENIIIGPFFVLVHPLKRFLIKKRTDIIQKLLIMLNDKIRDKTMGIVKQYRDMYKRLFEPPPSVEFVFETQEWMETLPDLVKTTEEQMRLVLFDYDILDFFQYPLSNPDFELKWEGIRWPNKILQQINVTREIQIIDIEKFQKEQVSETSSFDKTIESLTVQVQEYQFKDDPAKAIDNAKQCKKLSQQLLSAQELGHTLNHRQLLFELPELELENVDQLIVSFKPYETLWFTAANFYTLNQQYSQSNYMILRNSTYNSI